MGIHDADVDGAATRTHEHVARQQQTGIGLVPEGAEGEGRMSTGRPVSARVRTGICSFRKKDSIQASVVRCSFSASSIKMPMSGAASKPTTYGAPTGIGASTLTTTTCDA